MKTLLNNLSSFWLTYKIKILIGVFVALLTLGAFAYTYSNGYNAAQEQCVISKAALAEKGTKDHAEIEREVMQLPDPDLQRRYSRWLRD